MNDEPSAREQAHQIAAPFDMEGWEEELLADLLTAAIEVANGKHAAVADLQEALSALRESARRNSSPPYGPYDGGAA